MNYIYRSSIALAALAAVLASCQSKQEEEPLVKPFRVLQAADYLPVEAAEATIRLDVAPSQVYSRDAWLTVTQQGQELKLVTTTNPNPSSRSAELVLKTAAGDSMSLSVMQAGIIFGLPQEQAMIGGDEAINKQIKLSANIPVTYTPSHDWIKLTEEGKTLHVEVSANATGKARTGWIIAKGAGRTDSLQVTQASLADIVGRYEQKSQNLKEGGLVPETSVLEVKQLSATQAQVIIDNEYIWPASFTPGKGLELINGKVVRTLTPAGAKPTYIVTVLAADDTTTDPPNIIIGTREPVLINIAADGSIHFAEKTRLASEQQWASYGFIRSSSQHVAQGTYLGVYRMFIQPKLSKLP